ncbi:hypothetical protein HYH02_001892 [Chlamydomonas schloesseri]|uniref:Protein kinase domain-containing protein n=1 Tax=Chlamydomonas schloesseri TaxID=2026947 RepID=A0A835WUI2_9CHLO|nr:hypothetical protein HYH02_001892 [Chlamydomonas schloesseri]|eukprot:KAG2453679.1 hypothetical protein HYH02_001892 [Chlamydomonas schloesseri]
MAALQLSAARQLRSLLAWFAAAVAVRRGIATSLVYAAASAAASGACAPGDAAGIAHLGDLDASLLAQSVLNRSTLATWDFGVGAQSVKAPAGTAVALSCLTALNATVAPPSAAAGSVFLQPTALDLSAASGLSMAGVSLSTDCGTVLAYQQYLCTSLRAAGSLTTASELLQAFTVHAAAAAVARANLTVVLAANISIKDRVWPVGPPVMVDANITLVASPLRVPRVVLDLGLLTNVWNLTREANIEVHNLTLINLAPAYPNPPGYGLFTSRINAFIRSGKQVFLRNVTCVVPPEEVSYLRYWLTFLVSPVPEASARAAWLLIPQISIAAVNASGVYYAYQNGRTTILDNMAMVDGIGPGYPLLRSPSGLGQMQANSVRLTAINAVTSAQDVQLALLPNRTTPDEQGRRWVLIVNNISLGEAAGQWPQGPAGNTTSSSDARVGLEHTELNSGDTSCEDGACDTAVAPTAGNGTAAGVQLPGLTVFASLIPESPIRLGLGWRLSALGVPGGGGAELMVRNLVLTELAARANSSSSYSRSDPLAVLSSPLWGVSLAAGAAKTRLENCTLVVSAEELRLLQQALLPAEQLAAVMVAEGSSNAAGNGTGGSPQRRFDSALAAATRAFFTVDDGVQVGNATASQLVFVTGSTARFSMTNVTFRVPDPDSGEQANSGLTALGVPYDYGGSSSGSSSPPVGAVAGGVVGGCVLLMVVAGAAWLALRRRRRPQGVGSTSMTFVTLSGSAPVAAAGARAAGAGDSRAGGGGDDAASGSLSDAYRRHRPLQLSMSGSSPTLPSVGGHRNSADVEGSHVKGVSKYDTGPSYSAATPSGSGTQFVPVSGPSGSGLPAGLTAGAVHLGERATWAAGARGIQVLLAGEVGAPQQQLQQPARHATMTDSFNRPPTRTLSGLGLLRPGPPWGTGAQPTAAVQQRGGGSSGAPTAAEAGSSTSGSQSRSGGAALEQMRGVIAALGRDLGDAQQLLVHGVIGKGAHGTVYRGTWRGLPVAVKSMVFGPDDHARHQQRPLMEAAISSNLVHPNIVTTYSYELREVQHELASLFPELSQQGGGWRLLIIQEFCDAGPLRRLVDCGFFLTPPSHTNASPSPAPSLAQLTPLDTSSRQGDDNPSSVKARDAASTTPSSAVPFMPSAKDQAAVDPSTDAAGAQHPAHARPLLEDVPADVGGGRPASSLQAALRYVEAALQIARGLQHIHDKNIVHGDLNPNNVLLVRAPGTSLGFCLKVSDFGLSVHVGEGQSHLSNLFQGTPYYCAPEVILSGKVGKSADLYSLGIMLWELQNGTRPPWRMGVRLRTYPSLNTGELDFGPDTPPRYARLARECFHASSSLRPSVGAVVAALERIKEELAALASEMDETEPHQQ